MQLSFSVKKNPDFIFDYLTNMQKFVSVHPVITQIDRISDKNYLVHETLKLGFIPFSFTYPVIIGSTSINNAVTIRATVMKITEIQMTFLIKPDKDFTVIEENIKFKSPLPVRSIMESIFKKQHTQLFKNIEMMVD